MDDRSWATAFPSFLRLNNAQVICLEFITMDESGFLLEKDISWHHSLN